MATNPANSSFLTELIFDCNGRAPNIDANAITGRNCKRRANARLRSFDIGAEPRDGSSGGKQAIR
jgi:hypothetical protein